MRQAFGVTCDDPSARAPPHSSHLTAAFCSSHAHTLTSRLHVGNSPCAVCQKIMVEALEKNLYKVLEQNLVDLRITQARAKVGRALTSELERLLRVPPYQVT